MLKSIRNYDFIIIFILLLPLFSLLFLSKDGPLYVNIYLFGVSLLGIIRELMFYSNAQRSNSLVLNTKERLFGIGIVIFIFNNFFSYSISLTSRSFIGICYIFICFFILLNFERRTNSIVSFKPFKQTLKNITKFALAISIITLVLYLINRQYFSSIEKRYMGWSSSPTTYAIYLLWFVSFQLNWVNEKWKRNLLLCFLIFSIYLTGTRSGLIVGALIILLQFDFIINFVNKRFILFSLLFILFILFNDSLYDLLLNAGINQLLGRYSNDVDYSYLTRYNLKMEQMEMIKTSNLAELFLGHGYDYCINHLNKGFYTDEAKMLPHNDFLRFLIDYGLLFIIWYIYFIIKLFKGIGKYAIIPLLVYFSSFYHNMGLDHYNLILLITGYTLIKYQSFEKNNRLGKTF
jgi:hypothetical protein